MVRSILSSEWTAVAIGIVLVIVHGFWFWHTAHHADVLSGFGVALSVLGILVTAQPFIWHGVRKTAREQFNLTSEERLKERREQADELEHAAVSHVYRERVVGVALVAMGTLLNGYANAIARALSLSV